VKRLVFLLLLLIVPSSALADDTAPTPGSQLQNTQAGSSTAASSLLQPSGGASSALQSADSTAGGASQSASENLQQTGASDQAKLLVQGDADGGPVSGNDAPNLVWLNYILIVSMIATIVTGVVVYTQGRTQQKSK
jgi:hypothetical protein